MSLPDPAFDVLIPGIQQDLMNMESVVRGFADIDEEVESDPHWLDRYQFALTTSHRLRLFLSRIGAAP
jgi:hypothetical protein